MHSDLKYILAFHKIFKINLNNYFMQLYERYGYFQEAWFNLDFSPQIGIPKIYRGQFLQMKKTIGLRS